MMHTASFDADGFLVVAVVSFGEGELGYFELVPWTRYVDIELRIVDLLGPILGV